MEPPLSCHSLLLYMPEVLVCGGATSSDQIPSANMSSQDPTTSQCRSSHDYPRYPEQVEHIQEACMMPIMTLLPNGQVPIVNGVQTGHATFNSVRGPVGNQSNADHSVYALFNITFCSSFLYSGLHSFTLSLSLYHPGKRISNHGLSDLKYCPIIPLHCNSYSRR